LVFICDSIELTDLSHHIDEGRRPVEAVGAQLSCLVVPGEDVVVVVPSLADGQGGHQLVVHGTYVHIVGLHAVEVGGAVHQPGEVERQAEAQHRAGEEADAQRAAHHVVGEDHGQGEAADGHHHKVESGEKILKKYSRYKG